MDVPQNLLRHIHARALQGSGKMGVGIDLAQHRAILAKKEIDTGKIQPQRLRGPDGQRFFLAGQRVGFHRAANGQVTAKVAALTVAQHGRCGSVPHHVHPHIPAKAFHHRLLEQKRRAAQLADPF